MKKISIYVLALVAFTLFAASCSSDGIPTEPQEDLVKVTFNTSVWKEEVAPMGRASTSNYYPEKNQEHREVIILIRYLIYKADDGTLYKEVADQRLREKEYLINEIKPFETTLPKGDYKVAIVGVQHFNQEVESFRQQYNDAYLWDNHKLGSSKHVYHSTFDLQVGDSPLAKSISLKRKTGELEVFIEDSQELSKSNLLKFWITASMNTRLGLANGMWSHVVDDFEVDHSSLTLSELLKANEIPIPYCSNETYSPEAPYMKPFKGLVIPANNHLTKEERGKLTLNIQYSPDGHIEQRIIDMPAIYPNAITRIKGRFTPDQDLSFEITYENELGGIIYEEEF